MDPEDNRSISSNDTAFSSDEMTLMILRRVNFILFAIICLVGLLGNTFAVICIWRTSLRKISSNHYLVALAISDSVFLVGLFMMWLAKFGAPTYHAQGACQVVLFMLNCSSWLSSWYITALTVERFYVVHRPLSKTSVCTISRTRATIIGLIPWAPLFNIWVFFGGGITEEGTCNILSHYHEIALILNFVDTFLSFVLPVLLIVSCNISICVKLCKGDERVSIGKYAPVEMRKHGGGGTGDAASKAQRQERKITKTLVIISFVFVIMNLPSYAMRLRLYFFAVTNNENSLTIVGTVFENIFLILYYMNFSMNFVVYSLSSKNFRKAVKVMWMAKVVRTPMYRNVVSRTLTLSDSNSVRRFEDTSVRL